MKKLLIALSFMVFLLCSCSNTLTGDRGIYVDALSQVNDALKVESGVQLTSYTITDEDLVEENDTHNILGTKTFVYFMELLYKNSNYPVDENTHYFTAHYKEGNDVIQYNEMYFKAKMDKENNKIAAEIYGKSFFTAYSTNSLFYINLEIDYDFSNNSLFAFDIYLPEVYDRGVEGVHSDNELEENPNIHQIYKNNKLYNVSTSNQERIASITRYYNDNYWMSFRQNLDSLQSLGDFSSEYTKATNDMNVEM